MYNIYGMDTITKYISFDTKILFEQLKHLNIFPEFTMTKSSNSRYMLKMKKYKMTLGQYIDKNHYVDEKIIKIIHMLINKIHEFGILHGDLHAENIVMNDENDIKIIDIDSKYSRKIDNSKLTELIEFYTKFWENDNLKSIKDIVEYETNMWKYGYI